MKKILVVGTGGTIACVKDDNIRLDNPFKILDYIEKKDVSFECVSPFSVLSENIRIDLWQKLIDYLNAVDFEKYTGIIILHGSDTLAYTGALLGNIFYNRRIVLVASDKPVEDKASNAIQNFENAVDFICDRVEGVYISYDKLFRAVRTVSAGENDEFFTVGRQSDFIENPVLRNKNILIITPYVGIDYSNYNLDSVDAVLHAMYHSATAPENAAEFAAKCKKENIPFYFVTSKSSADYESAKDFGNIIFNSTLENAFARLLLTDNGFQL
ncbi:MAG TPA: hypothetical protein DD404_02065 [Ruminococcaceae bacterium]|nr:hypothetical protein [Oscillospiraceae bacterium]